MELTPRQAYGIGARPAGTTASQESTGLVATLRLGVELFSFKRGCWLKSRGPEMLEGIGAAGRTDLIRDAIGHGIAER